MVGLKLGHSKVELVYDLQEEAEFQNLLITGMQERGVKKSSEGVGFADQAQLLLAVSLRFGPEGAPAMPESVCSSTQ